MAKDFEQICTAAAEDVRKARAALGAACRFGAPAEEIAECRANLQAAKVIRLRADADAMAADPATARRLPLIDSDADPDVKPSAENHKALTQAEQLACAEFLRSHPVSRDPDDDAWDRETRKTWTALLASHTAAHVALGCSENSPCRRGGSSR